MSTVPDWIVIAGTLAAILFGGGGVFGVLKWLMGHKVRELATTQKDILRRLEAVEHVEAARAVLRTDAFKRERECFELVRSQLESAHNALQNASHDYPRFTRQGDARMRHVAKTVSSLLHYRRTCQSRFRTPSSRQITFEAKPDQGAGAVLPPLVTRYPPRQQHRTRRPIRSRGDGP